MGNQNKNTRQQSTAWLFFSHLHICSVDGEKNIRGVATKYCLHRKMSDSIKTNNNNHCWIESNGESKKKSDKSSRHVVMLYYFCTFISFFFFVRFVRFSNAGTGTNFVRESSFVANLFLFLLCVCVCVPLIEFQSFDSLVLLLPVHRCSYWLSGFLVLWILQIKFVPKIYEKSDSKIQIDWYGAMYFFLLLPFF